MSQTISPQELKQLLESDEIYALIDVRERNEYEQGQIFGATQVSRRTLEARIPALVPLRSAKIVLYDDDGVRAGLAAKTLESHGYTAVHTLAGALAGWKKAGFPLVEGIHVLSKAFGEIVGELRGIVPAISPVELKKQLEAEPDGHVIIEVRPAAEVRKTGSIPGAINIPGVELPLRIADYAATGRKIIITCAGRTRGFIATATLKKMGVGHVFDLTNGTLGWRLAGYELEERVPAGPAPSAMSRRAVDDFAAGLAIEENVELLSLEQFEALRRRSANHPLYLLDVRSEEEYAHIGHIPGSLSIPGGQAIQNTDDVVAVRQANIVFICDNGTRSIITAYWYKQMGFTNVYVLRGGLETWLQAGNKTERGTGEELPLGFSGIRRQVEKVDASGLKTRLETESGKILLVDVSDGKSFAGGHIPGARWLPRGRLEQRIAEVVGGGPQTLIITGNDTYDPTFAARTLLELGYTNVQVLAGGNEGWQKAGYDIARGLEGIQADDWQVHLTEYGLEEAKRYFAWEESLVHLPEYMGYFQRKKIV
jgi:rhodanese-related sulfurtransferase